MKIETSTAGAARGSADRRARRIDPQRDPGARRRPVRRDRGGRRTARDRHGGRPARAARRRRSCAPGEVVLPARLLLDVVRQLPGDSVTLELRPEQQDVELVGGHGAASTCARCAATTSPSPEPGGDREVAMPAQAFVETIARVSRSASRDETRPILTGILVSARGRRAAHGRDRLLSPERQGDAARAAARRGLRGERPGARAARSSRGSSRAETEQITIGVRTNQVVFSVGGADAVLAADRWSVPELPPAAARAVRARADAEHRGAR